MNAEALKTVSLCSLFVLILGAIGSIVAIITNAILFFMDSPSSKTYMYMVETKLFASQYFPYYLLTAAAFAGVGLLIIYLWKQNRSLKRTIFWFKK